MQISLKRTVCLRTRFQTEVKIDSGAFWGQTIFHPIPFGRLSDIHVEGVLGLNQAEQVTSYGLHSKSWLLSRFLVSLFKAARLTST